MATYSHLVLIVAVAMAGAGVASVFASGMVQRSLLCSFLFSLFSFLFSLFSFLNPSGMVQHSLLCSFLSPLLHLLAVVGKGTNGGEQQNQLDLHHVLQRLLTTLRTLDRWGVKQPNTQTQHKA